MKSLQLLENLSFNERNPEAEPLYVDKNGRIIRWSLESGESIKEHRVPDSPFYVVILEGSGIFAGGDEKEVRYGKGTLLVFEPGERHTVRATDQKLVFIGFLHGAPSNVSDKVGGVIGHQAP